jgi:hypothetical protein
MPVTTILWVNDGTRQCVFVMPISIERREAQLAELGIQVSDRRAMRWPGPVNAQCLLPTGEGYRFECEGVSRAQLAEAAALGFRVLRAAADLIGAAELAGDAAEAGRHGLLARGPGDHFPWMALDGPDAFPWSKIRELPFQLASGEAETLLPLSALIGRKCRLIGPDTVVSGDFDAERVNIFVNEEGRIEAVTFG